VRSRYWRLTLYPQAGEAGGCFVSAGGAGGGRRGSRPDQARARAEAARRAAQKVRRYCAANRLNRLGTLTYRGEGCHDPRALRRDLGGFFRELRGGLGGVPLPYLWVPEWHPGGHGLHAHFAVGRFVPRSLIERAWDRGFVHIKLLGDLPVGSGTLGEARKASRYLAKYVRKGIEDAERLAGLHRYEVAQGFQPETAVFEARTEAQVIEQASEAMGAPPAYVWRSTGVEGWHGPPACWVSWD
jgi:hypothetical protein